ELHTGHRRLGKADFALTNPTIRLGQMAHDREGRTEQRFLDLFPLTGPIRSIRIERLHSLNASIQEVADQYTNGQANRPANQNTHQAQDDLATPTAHKSLTYDNGLENRELRFGRTRFQPGQTFGGIAN